MSRANVVLMGLALVGCSSIVTVNGKELLEDQWKADIATVRSRVAVDLSCDADKVSVKVLDNFGGQMRYASNVSAEGCGRSAVYSRVDVRASLVLNSVSAK